MTISAFGIDYGTDYPPSRMAMPSIWASQDQQSEAGRVALTAHNQTARFPERLIERLLIEHPFIGEVSGTVTESGTPVARVVRVYRRSDGQYVGEAVSDSATGLYTLAGMRQGVEYFAVAFDDTSASPDFNAMILDRIEP